MLPIAVQVFVSREPPLNVLNVLTAHGVSAQALTYVAVAIDLRFIAVPDELTVPPHVYGIPRERLPPAAPSIFSSLEAPHHIERLPVPYAGAFGEAGCRFDPRGYNVESGHVGSGAGGIRAGA